MAAIARLNALALALALFGLTAAVSAQSAAPAKDSSEHVTAAIKWVDTADAIRPGK